MGKKNDSNRTRLGLSKDSPFFRLKSPELVSAKQLNNDRIMTEIQILQFLRRKTMNATLTRDVERISEALNQCQSELSEAVLNSVEHQRKEVKDAAQQGYGTVKEKAQQLLQKGAEAQEKLGGHVSDYNTKLQDATKELPNQINRTVVSYPWLALAAAITLGAILAWLMKPSFKAE
jgi:ElaB/YqjD/DUF883 family membrane-anchored ribosome-binding protein